jgi:CheY-like chemotaxis protein
MEKRKVLIVDDNQITCLILSEILEKYQLDITCFNEAESALEYLQKESNNLNALPEIIFLDINLPAMDGWDFLNEFIELNTQIAKRINIYLISSSNSDTDMEKALTYSIVKGYLVKPLIEEDIVRIL